MRRRFTEAAPHHLYKYTGFDESSQDSIRRLEDVVLRSTIYLSSPRDFNDPFDMSAFFDFSGTPQEKRERIKAILKRLKPELGYVKREQEITRSLSEPEQLINSAESAFQQQIDKAGVYCLTSDPRHILMWSHYARNHKGLCFQFSVPSDIYTFCAAMRMDYSEEYPVVRWINDDHRELQQMILRKSKLWKYEDEYRIVSIGNAGRHLKFRPQALSAIIFGCNCADSTRQAVIEMLRRRQVDAPPPRLFQAEKHPKNYELLLKRVRC